MRNNMCEDALKAGFQRVMFLDDDVVPPPDVYARLAQHNQDIVSGLYYRRHDPVLPVAMKIDANGQPQWVRHGIRRTVFSKWISWELGVCSFTGACSSRCPGRGSSGRSGRKDGNALSEDFAFCRNAKRTGFKVLLDTSVKCEHIGLGQHRRWMGASNRVHYHD